MDAGSLVPGLFLLTFSVVILAGIYLTMRVKGKQEGDDKS